MLRIGNRELGAQKGLALLKQAIRQEIGIEVHHVLTVDFEGFVSIVDHLEGIPVKVACPIEDCFISDEADAGCESLSLTAGEHLLDGATALKFARSRHGRSDIDRARRQQAVLSGLKERLTRPAILSKLPGLWSRLNQYVTTDIDVETALKMGTLVARVERDALHGLVLRSPIVDERVTSDGKQVLVLDRKKARAAVASLFSRPRPGARRYSVCPAPDVGLRWRENLKRRSQKDTDEKVTVLPQ